MDFPGGSVVLNPPVSSGDPGSMPGSGSSPGEGMATHSSILAWRNPGMEDLGGLQFMSCKRVGHDLVSK